MKMRYLQRITISYFSLLLKQQKTAETLAMLEFPLFFIRERAGIRTPDNLIKSQVLYHLSYTPVFNFLPCLSR